MLRPLCGVEARDFPQVTAEGIKILDGLRARVATPPQQWYHHHHHHRHHYHHAPFSVTIDIVTITNAITATTFVMYTTPHHPALPPLPLLTRLVKII
jgi:hypothetical protein